MRIAVVDLGTNSTRLLVADVEAGAAPLQIDRQTTVTRLGEGVDRDGSLLPAAIDRVETAVARYRQLADEAEAEHRIAVATSAVREAANGQELADRLRERHGFEVRTIDGDEEARLTFLGATTSRADLGAPPTTSGGPPVPAASSPATAAASPPAGEPPRGPDTMVVDVGGGSTELVSGRPGEPPTFHASTRLGSVRQTERHLAHDPPRHDELVALADEAAEAIAAAVPGAVLERVGRVVAVAGTPTSLAAIDQRLDPYDPDRVDGYRLELAACQRILAELALHPLDRRRAMTGLHPERAPTIVAGAAILVQAVLLIGVPEIEVSEADLLDGAAIDATS